MKGTASRLGFVLLLAATLLASPAQAANKKKAKAKATAKSKATASQTTKLPPKMPPAKTSTTEQVPAVVKSSRKISGGTKIVYGSSAWNVDSSKPDSAFLFLRDKSSGKVAKILLEETEPDSSVFGGTFALNWGQIGEIDPEIYIPPKNMRESDEAVSKFYKLLETQQIKKMPLIIKADDAGTKLIDVYDTDEQAKRAQAAYDAEVRAKTQPSLAKPVMSEQDLEAAKKAEQQKMLQKLAEEAAKRDADRVRMEQIERQKAEERARQMRELSEKEQKARQAQAAQFAQKALAHYQAGEFPAAEENFRKAVELDPNNKSHYFRYGVTLYRTEKFNDALVILKLAQDEPATVLEKKYYMGLVHMRLKELDPALALFREVGAAKDPVMSPSAAFYEGVIYFTQEKYEAAKEPFERVIDTSKDPRLDQQAEDYLDKLTALIAQQKMMSKRLFTNATVGLMYDSNVLLAPDNVTSQGAATKEGDVRLMATADAEYRPLFTNTHELGVKGLAYVMYSSKDAVSKADPTLANFSLPYSYKGMAFGKGYKLGLKPAYEITYMDANEDGAREQILTSSVVSIDNTFVMAKDWFSSYVVEVRSDDSKTADSTGDNDADAMKSTIKTNQTLLLEKSGKEAVVGSLGYTINSAKGDNKYYSRYDIGATYVRPITKWDASWNIGLQYYGLNYTKALTTKREDKNITFTTGISKPVRDWVTWGITGSYSNNASNVDANGYSKFTLMTTATFNYSQ